MPTSSPYAPITVDNTDLYSLIFGNLTEEDAQREALTDLSTGETRTYGELHQRIIACAGWLEHQGVQPGDVVALHCPNSEAFIIVAQACFRIGAVLSPLSLLSTADSVEKQLRDSHAVMLITISMFNDVSGAGARAYGLSDDKIILLDTAAGLPAILTAGHTPSPVTINAASDLAVLPYSSGTTGLPKGVQLSHQQLVCNLRQIEGMNLVRREDVMLGMLPFFHIYGLTVLCNSALYMRAKIIIMPKFDLEAFLQAHVDYKITFTPIAPPVAVALAKHPIVDNYDLSSMRAIFSGAATLDEELAVAVQNRLGVPVEQGYGMTETSPLACANVDPSINRGSIGIAAPNTETKLVDVETGEEIPVPESGMSAAGELWVRGPQNMLGYHNRPEETASTLVGDGWLATGDMATQNEHGHLFIVDRLKELIKYKGYQVPPAELEAVLLTHPSIADSAVIGVRREEDGEEVPKAFVVVRPDATLTAEEVMDFVAAKVEPYKKVRMVEFIDQVPKSATGKILRRELRDQ